MKFVLASALRFVFISLWLVAIVMFTVGLTCHTPWLSLASVISLVLLMSLTFTWSAQNPFLGLDDIAEIIVDHWSAK